MGVYLSVIVPCFNEEETINTFYNDAIKECNSLGQSYEFIFVDDGSKDRTLTILRELALNDNNVHYISLSRNFGQDAAMLAGLRAASGDYITKLDVDGQDPLDLIPEMLKVVTSGEYDCAATRRVNRKGDPPIRSFFAYCFYALMNKISDVEIVSGAREYRLMNRKYLNALLELQERNRFLKGLYPWIGFKVKFFEYKNIERIAGESKWSFWKLFSYSIDGIVAFSTKPLLIASVLGIFMFLASIIGAVVVVIQKYVQQLPNTGWASIMCLILFVSGVQLFTTGILGQYLAKLYIEAKQRPHYIIKEQA